MRLEDTIRAYHEALFDTDREAAFAVVAAALREGLTAERIVFDVVVPATEDMMAAITRDLDANLAQHFMTAQIASEVTEQMLTRFASPPQVLGRVVLGTASGDLHSLGKRIVTGCLKALMVDVIDLGVNVPPERFVAAALDQGAGVIGISAMMVHTAAGEQGSLRVRELLREARLEERIQIVVGGAPYRFDETLYQRVGADAWAPDAMSGARLITRLVQEVRA